MAIVFMNEGEISLDALLTLGVSVKEKENSIGKFGTGGPNAIAVLLRHGHKVMIHTGKNSYTFEKIRKEIRGQAFDMVGVKENGRKVRELGFTTELGKFWELWMAYRELYSNAVDEKKGQVYKLNFPATTKPDAVDQTLIIVHGREFEEVHDKRHTFILPKANLHLVYANNQVEIYEGKNENLYYQGIKAKKLDEPSRFTYNLQVGTLTEDRTLEDTYMATSVICRAWKECEDETALRQAVAFTPDTFENKLYWQYSCSGPLPVPFKNAIKAQRKNTDGVTSPVLELYHRELTDVEDLYNVIKLNEVEKEQYERALYFLKETGLMPELKYEVVFVDNLSDTDLGQATKDKKIILNKLAFSHGTKILARVILEEYLHCEHGFKDFDRVFQNHLFDTIMNMGEQMRGEPL